MHRFRANLLIAGLLAAGPALLLLVAGRALTSRPGFLEAIANGFVRFLLLELFEAAVGAIGPWAKASLSIAVAVRRNGPCQRSVCISVGPRMGA